jgi:hypothetical protein
VLLLYARDLETAYLVRLARFEDDELSALMLARGTGKYGWFCCFSKKLLRLLWKPYILTLFPGI